MPPSPLLCADFFLQMCRSLDITPPLEVSHAQSLVDRANEMIQSTAEHLARLLPYPLAHSRCLDVICSLNGFGSHAAWATFSENFVRIPYERRISLPYSAALAFTLLGPERTTNLQHPLARNFLQQSEQLLREATGLPTPIATEAFHLLYSRAGSITRPLHIDSNAERFPSFTKGEVMDLLEQSDFDPAMQIMGMLAKCPLADGKRTTWSNLDKLTVGQLMEEPTALPDKDVGFGYPGWAHTVPTAITQIKRHGELIDADRKSEASLLGTPLDGTPSVSPAKLHSLATRVACREAIEEMLAPYMQTPVLQALSRIETEHGFFDEFGVIPYAEYLGHWRDHALARADADGIIPVALGEPFHGHKLSIIIVPRNLESDAGKFDEVEAMLHEPDGRPAAVLSVGLYRGGSGLAYDFLLAMDEVDDEDATEVGIAMAMSHDTLRHLDGHLDKVAFVRRWELRHDLRGSGLGKEFLDAVLARTLQGARARPVLAVRLDPAQFDLPPFSDWPKTHAPELTDPKLKLRAYWDDSVAGHQSWIQKNIPAVVHYDFFPAAYSRNHLRALFAVAHANQSIAAFHAGTASGD